MTETVAPIWDVVIVGAGTAGLPAAIFAARRGAKVMLIEAADRIGGTLYLSSGSFAAAGTRRQAEKGVEDSAQNHYEDCLRINGGTGDKAALKLWCDHGAATFDWLMEAGLALPPADPVLSAAHEFYNAPRTYNPLKGGEAYLDLLAPMLQALIETGAVTLALNTRMTGLITGEGGVVQGVKTDSQGDILAKSVVLTTGGYGSNGELWRQLHGRPHYAYVYQHALGDGLIAARAVGADVRHAENFLLTFGGVHDIDVPGKYWLAARVMPVMRQPWEIFVSDKGERFMAEDNPSPDARERALLAQPSLTFWVIDDARIRRESPPLFMWPEDKVARAFAQGDEFRTADTLDALARQIGVDPAVLAATVADYNQAQASGVDAFGRKYMPLPISEGPFHAFKGYGTNVVSWAGVAVNGDLQVIDAEDKPIPNLYAAGEILGMGVFGKSFLGGSTIAASLTFGHRLGEYILAW
jgi:fumarate reductase flavoprotein subunit